MALPVLDGNQSATTLSSVVTGGEHIVAHSVVSLGSTAISNINSAVSGSAVTIPGLARLGNSIASNGSADANLDFIKIGGHQDGQNQVAHIVHVSAGGAMKVDASGSSVTFSQAPVTFGAITGSASILNFPATQTVAGTVTANVSAQDLYGSNSPTGGTFLRAVNYYEDSIGGNGEFLRVNNDLGGGMPVRTIVGQVLDVSGTVTANLSAQFQDAETSLYAVRSAMAYDDDGDLKEVSNSLPLPVVVNAGSVTIGSVPNGSLTTRFGTPTTASVAFATSCVTNANRKYLLIQNVTTGSNVITVGIGFTPTTTQGIQLTAGAGITFESSYIPTGAVYVLSSVTASNFTILEA